MKSARLLVLALALTLSSICCSDLDDSPHCARLNEADCVADPYCSPITGYRLHQQLACFNHGFAGCDRRDRVCGDAITTATSPDGVCWQFNNTCLPGGFKATYSQDASCRYAEFRPDNECPP